MLSDMTGPDMVRLLVVEDSPDDLELLVRALRTSGLRFEWKGVSTAPEFSDALGEAWDVVLCDYHLPSFDAFRALEMLKERSLDLPFILVSGVLGEEAAVAVMRAGAHDFFAKGRLARLRPAIERELAEARLRADTRMAEAEKARLLVELQRALAARDDFLVLASHELRTPLTILGLELEAQARALARSGSPAPPRAESIRRQIEWLARMVDRCFDVTKLSSEPLVLSRRETDLRAVVVEVVERLRDWIDQSGCALSLESLESIVGQWDPVRLDSVVTTLVANALRFGAGKPITVSARREGRRALLSVRDQGIGISEEQQTTLFRKFARAVPSENYGGLGLGLWVVDQIVRAHGGGIRVDSRKGEGASFTVDLPLERVDGNTA
jgi:signal transduction histidine kinase